MPVGIAKCERCGIEFKWKKSSGIPARWCSRKCQKIRIDITSKCEVCEKEYIWKKGKDKDFSTFCSRKCQYKMTGKWVSESKTFWKKATEEEKLHRMKDLFEKHVIRQEGCWDWSGVIHHSGYAPLKIDDLQTNAHIVSWMIYRGKIPEKLIVCHICDNKKCTNPDHLFLGSYSDNTQDCLKKDRLGNAKLKVSDVKEIKNSLLNGVKGSYLAKKYGVTNVAISYIKTGKQWKHITIE